MLCLVHDVSYSTKSLMGIKKYIEYSFWKLYSHIIAVSNDFLLRENFSFPEMSGCLNRTRAGVIIYLPQNSSPAISRTNNSAWIKSRN